MFDPVTMALCECECKENPEGGNTGGGAAAIDLSQYNLLLDGGSVPVSMSNLVFMLFSNGGGSIFGTDENGFWDAVKTDKQLKFVIAVSEMGVVVTADGTCHVKDTNGNTVTIEMSFLVNVNGWMRATVIFDNSFNGGNVRMAVAVEPLAIPETQGVV